MMLISAVQDWIQALAAMVVVIGLPLAYLQLRAASKSTRGSVLLKLIEEWRSPEVYEAVSYIHELRREWKRVEPDLRKWDSLAESWVLGHIGNSSSTQLGSEWMKRRIASQFISKTGYMMARGYISPDDFFSVAPEVPRLLLVLEPIELAICRYFETQEPQVAEWDAPFHKIEFAAVQREYDRWFKADGARLLECRRRV